MPKITDMPKFAYDGAISFASFSAQHRTILDVGGIPEEQRVGYLSVCFVGRAADMILGLYGPGGFPVAGLNYDQSVEALSLHFIAFEMDHHRERRFNSLKLQDFPTIAQFLDSFYAEIAKRPHGLTVMWKKGKIVQACGDFAAITLELERHMEDAVGFAAFVAILLRLQPLMAVGPAVHPSVGVAAVSSSNARLAELEAALAAMRSAASGKRGRGADGMKGVKGACYQCGEVGHYKHECPSLTREKEGVFTGSCHKCGKVGHKSVDCKAVNRRTYVTVPLSVAELEGRGGNSEWLHAEASLPEGKAAVLLDSGSGAEVVSTQWVKEHKVKVVNARVAIRFTFANGEQAISTQQVRTRMTIGEWTGMVTLRVCPKLLPGVDIILGMPWLRAHNPVIDWAAGSVMIGEAVLMGMPPAQRSEGVERGVPTVPAAGNVRIAMLGAAKMRKEMSAKDSVEMQAIWVCAVTAAQDAGKTAADFISKSTTELQRAAVRKVLDEFVDVFPPELPKGVPQAPVKHEIHLEPGAVPPAARPFRLSAAEADVLTEKIAEFMAQGIVRPSASPFGAPVLLIKKKDGSFRLCIDYRRLNEITRKDKFPLPLIEDLLERLVNQRVFSKIDLRSGYYQVAVEEESIERTAFVTPAGSFEWLAMPLGLCNAPSTFQRMMVKALGPLINKCVVVYLDDCLVYSRSHEEHVGHLRAVLAAFRKHHLFANVEKCTFAAASVVFCGHVVSFNEVRMEDDKVEAVRTWLPPTTVGELRSFIGFVNYYRRFLRHIGGVAAPLTELMGRGATNQHLKLSETQLRAFEAIKLLVTSEPVLRAFDPNKPVALFADSSDAQAGSFWAQDHGFGWQPGAFESHKLSPAETRYSVRDKELLAIVQACRRWRHRLHGRPVLVFTDHESLETLLKGECKEFLSDRVARQLEFLSQFDLKVVYLAGKKQVVADALSRLPSGSLGSATVAGLTVSVDIGEGVRDAWKAEQREDAYLGPVMAVLEKRSLVGLARSEHAMRQAFRFGLSKEGLLVFKEGNRLCVPTVRKLQVLKEHHDVAFAGHVGASKTLQAIAQRFFWPLMRKDVRRYVQSCVVCQRVKPDLHPPVVAHQPLPVPVERWDTVSIDWITGLPLTKEGFNAIMSVTDNTTGRVRLLKTRETASSEESAQLYLDNIFTQHGLSRKIVSDRDPKFTAEFWRELMGKLGTQLGFSTAGYAQADGRSERSNQTAENHLRALVDYNQADWGSKLFAVEFAINSHANATTGFSPFMLDLGREPLVPAAFLLEPQLGGEGGAGSGAFISKVRAALTSARSTLARSHEDVVARLLRGREPAVPFAVGDLVLVNRAAARDPISADAGVPKLSPRFVGPFPVAQVLGPATYRLTLPPRMRCHNTFNISKLKRFVANEFVGREEAAPGPVAADAQGHDLYEVERVLDKKWLRKKLWYLVEWTGYTEPSWEPASALQAARVKLIIKQFEERYQPPRGVRVMRQRKGA